MIPFYTWPVARGHKGIWGTFNPRGTAADGILDIKFQKFTRPYVLVASFESRDSNIRMHLLK